MIRRPIRTFRRYLLDRMVLRPTRHVLEYAPKQRVVLNTACGSLECFVEKNYEDDAPPELLALKFPGTAGRAERSTQFPMSMLPDVRVALWTWNPPGYGGSGGRARMSEIADASCEFWHEVTRREQDERTRTWLCGNSLGCVTALNVCAAVRPDSNRSAIVLRNAPPLVHVVKRVAAQYPLGGLIDPVAESLCDSMNALITAPQVDLPAVFLQSELDTLVPLDYQNEVVGAYAGPHRVVVMEGLGHSCLATDEHESAIRDSIQWLWTRSGCQSDEPSNAP